MTPRNPDMPMISGTLHKLKCQAGSGWREFDDFECASSSEEWL